MKSFFLILILSSLFFSCQKEEQIVDTQAASTTIPIDKEEKDPLFAETEKDESCDTEEDLEKKIEEAAKKKEAFSLQGGDSGCAVNEE